MQNYAQTPAIKDLIECTQKIVVIQADNPDGDSLASALAMEEILGDMGKDVYLYCGVDIPSYLRYMQGADRVVNELPVKFDLSIILDTSSNTLLEQLDKDAGKSRLATKPCIVIDHHTNVSSVQFATAILNAKAVATGEIIYELAIQLKWKLNQQAAELLAIAILSDSLGLTSESTSSRSVHIIGDLIDKGVSLAALENARRETMRRDAELVHYKGELLKRVEFYNEAHLAIVKIPHEEIVKYSPLYNPPMLVLDDMRLAKEVNVAIAFKLYNDGKVTAKIRCNYGYAVADKLAEHFGGGGHPYAAGFKITKGKSYEQIKAEVIKKCNELQAELIEHDKAA